MMGDRETGSSKFRFKLNNNDRQRPVKSFDPSVFVHLPNKLQNYLKSQLQRLGNNGKSMSWGSNTEKGNRERSSAFVVDLDRQMQAWKDNPSWVDQQPHIKVSVPKDSLCSLNVKLNVGLPPDAVYNIVIDPDNKRVFKNIKEVISRKVLLDDGMRQVVDLEQAAIWRFLWWSGTISVHVLVDQNRKDHSLKFRQIKTGFMKRFEGCWRVEPLHVDEMMCAPFRPKTWQEYDACTRGKGRIGSVVSLEQIIEPAIIPPPPISWYLRGITARTTEMLIHDLCEETARIRGGFESERSKDEIRLSATNVNSATHLRDIKERWARHRSNARKCQRRLVIAK